MDDQILTFVLLAVGFVLLGVELMIPSGGMIGAICIASFLGSAWFAYQSWAESNPLYWRIYITTFIALIPVTLYGIYYLLTQTAFGNRVLLVAPSSEEVTPYQAEHLHLESLIGRKGSVISPLKPGGLVEIDGERLHATGDGFIIEAGAPIRVVEIRGTRVIVQPIHEAKAVLPDSPPELDVLKPAQRTPETLARNEIIDPFLQDDQAE